MRINVKAVSLQLDAATRAEIERRMHASLGRLAHRILRVAVRVTDRNGPRGGEDIACAVELRLRPRGRIYIEETDIDLAGAVNRAADTAASAVVRTTEKTRDQQRRPSTDPVFGTSGA
ncbi:MAG TPA: HPF/RaiA family ribosome-associated protein [Spirochaetia bacterium]